MKGSMILLRGLAFWVFVGLCIFSVRISLGFSSHRNLIPTTYVCLAAMLGALSMSRGRARLLCTAYLVLTIALLNILVSSPGLLAARYPALITALLSLISFGLLIAAIWLPVRLRTQTFPLSLAMKRIVYRATAATTLSLGIPLVCITTLLILHSLFEKGRQWSLLSLNVYTYGLLFVGSSCSMASLALFWPPVAFDWRSFYRSWLTAMFGTMLVVAWLAESMLQTDWMIFALSQLGTIAIYFLACYLERSLETVQVPQG